jgi:hypothetical protein
MSFIVYHFYPITKTLRGVLSVIFNGKKPILIGSIHLPRFISQDLVPKWTLDDLESYVVENVRIFEEGGFDGVFIQDQTPGESSNLSIGLTSVLARKAVLAAKSMEIGIVIESDCPEVSLACASASGASFIRQKVFVGSMVKSQGIVCGMGDRAIRERSNLHASTVILADVYDRTGIPLGSLPPEVAARQCVSIGADGLVLTGQNMGETLSLIDQVRQVVRGVPLIVGGGVDENTIHCVVEKADGAIISSSLKSDETPNLWDVDKIRALVKMARNQVGKS